MMDIDGMVLVSTHLLDTTTGNSMRQRVRHQESQVARRSISGRFDLMTVGLLLHDGRLGVVHFFLVGKCDRLFAVVIYGFAVVLDAMG
jgi:hypothetical protein